MARTRALAPPADITRAILMPYFPHISGMISREFSGDGGRSTEEYRLGHAKQFEGVALDTGEFG